MLWGSYAQRKASVVDPQRNCILKAVHPSPLSAYRGFFGCRHFSRANEYLQSTAGSRSDGKNAGRGETLRVPGAFCRGPGRSAVTSARGGGFFRFSGFPIFSCAGGFCTDGEGAVEGGRCLSAVRAYRGAVRASLAIPGRRGSVRRRHSCVGRRSAGTEFRGDGSLERGRRSLRVR